MGHLLVSSPAIFELSVLLISIVAGIFGAILGLGGGVIVVPALTLLFGINIRYAIGASIVSIIATSSAAAAAYVRDHLTNIRVAMLLEVSTTLGAVAGAIASTRFHASSLFGLFAAVLFYSAYMMFRKREEHVVPPEQAHPWAKKLSLNSTYPDFQTGRDIAYAVTGVPVGLILMIGAGFLSALLGIGSGSLKVPAMDSAMSLPIKVSTATSSFMIGVTAAASAGAYYMRGDILPPLAAPVALGVLGGSWLGARIMVRMHSRKIRQLFIAVLFLIALQMMLRAFGVGRS